RKIVCFQVHGKAVSCNNFNQGSQKIIKLNATLTPQDCCTGIILFTFCPIIAPFLGMEKEVFCVLKPAAYQTKTQQAKTIVKLTEKPFLVMLQLKSMFMVNNVRRSRPDKTSQSSQISEKRLFHV